MGRTSLLGAVALTCIGCAHEVAEAPAPAVGMTWGDVAGWRAPAPVPAPASPAPAQPHPRAPRSSPSAAIPNGAPCLGDLARLGVAFQPLDFVKGVTTPVKIMGPIGGLRFRAVAGMQLVLDCRLAVALAWSAPHLRGLGIEELRFSGAYVDRRTRAGRPSLHARGLAIDVHAMLTHDAVVSVERDYERGMIDGCRSDAPLLNQVACRLKGLGLYKELLTPDYDYDHRNHFHLGVAPVETAD